MHSYKLTINTSSVVYVKRIRAEENIFPTARMFFFVYSSTGSNSSLTLGSFSIVK